MNMATNYREAIKAMPEVVESLQALSNEIEKHHKSLRLGNAIRTGVAIEQAKQDLRHQLQEMSSLIRTALGDPALSE